MRSRTLSFNPTLFWKNAARFWPVWVVYTFIWVVALPARVVLEHLSFYGTGANNALAMFVSRDVPDFIQDGIILAFLFGLAAAFAVFSYLYNPRAAGLMHTLPIRREGLFLTNWLSGFSFLVVPHLFIALLTLLAELAVGVVDAGAVGLWLLSQTGVCLYFYSFAVLCAMFTGNLVALPAFYGILSFLPLGLVTLLTELVSLFAFGYVTNTGIPYDVAQWFTPAIQLMSEMGMRSVWEDGILSGYRFAGLPCLAVYVLAALLLTLCSLLLYRRRHVETAGDIVAVPWARPVFRYGFAFCCSLCGTLFFYEVFFRELMGPPFLPIAVGALVWGVLGYFVANMFLQKSFRVFHKGWAGCGGLCLVLLALIVGLWADLPGTEHWVGDPDDFAQIQLDVYSLPPYDTGDNPSVLASDAEERTELVGLHRTIVDGLDEYRDFHYRTQNRPYSEEVVTLRFRYMKEDGSITQRSYSLPVWEERQEEETSLESRLLSLVNHPSRVASEYFPKDPDAAAVSGSLFLLRPLGDDAFEWEEVELDAVQAAALDEAVRNDVAAGRLGYRLLPTDEMYDRSFHELQLTYHWREDNGRAIQETDEKYPGATAAETSSRTVTFALLPTATQTLNALDQLALAPHALSFP